MNWDAKRCIPGNKLNYTPEYQDDISFIDLYNHHKSTRHMDGEAVAVSELTLTLTPKLFYTPKPD